MKTSMFFGMSILIIFDSILRGFGEGFGRFKSGIFLFFPMLSSKVLSLFSFDVIGINLVYTYGIAIASF